MVKDSKILVKINGLKKYFESSKGFLGNKASKVKAVDDISFDIKKGETFGLVGESGCGKTTTGRTIIRLYKPTAGQIIYDGNNIANLNNKELIQYKRKIQMIFQDPYSSLNPRMTVSDIISEPLIAHGIGNRKEREEKIAYLLNRVGLRPNHANRYPHEFSGGQRQRVGIARALSINPEFIICDEPISALDVSIQAQVVNMLEELQEEFGLTYLFIAHDLSMVRHISNRIGVMYLGKLVEIAKSDELYNNTIHPYTKALLSAIPIADPVTSRLNQRIIVEGDVPSPLNPPSGCRFRTRCTYATDKCKNEEPMMREVGTGHFVACHHF